MSSVIPFFLLINAIRLTRKKRRELKIAGESMNLTIANLMYREEFERNPVGKGSRNR